MNPAIARELDKQSFRFGVPVEDILGRSRTRGASAARRAVWSALLTRYPEGEFPASLLAKIFDRQPSIIRAGVVMHQRGLTQWPRYRKDVPRRPDETDVEFLTRKLTRIRREYADAKGHWRPLAPQEQLRAEAERVAEQLRQAKLYASGKEMP